jgi:hypothetical protein
MTGNAKSEKRKAKSEKRKAKSEKRKAKSGFLALLGMTRGKDARQNLFALWGGPG